VGKAGMSSSTSEEVGKTWYEDTDTNVFKNRREKHYRGFKIERVGSLVVDFWRIPRSTSYLLTEIEEELVDDNQRTVTPR